jgi:hypothetical protein
MRIVSFILYLVTAATCFIGGYKLGQLNPPIEQPLAQPAPATVAMDPSLDTVDDAPIPLPPVSQVDALALRAQEPRQTLSDRTGRQLMGEILEVTADSLKFRRQADSLVVTIPTAMLSADDQAFAAYLWQHKKPAQAASPQSMEDKIWAELFK